METTGQPRRQDPLGELLASINRVQEMEYRIYMWLRDEYPWSIRDTLDRMWMSSVSRRVCLKQLRASIERLEKEYRIYTSLRDGYPWFMGDTIDGRWMSNVDSLRSHVDTTGRRTKGEFLERPSASRLSDKKPLVILLLAMALSLSGGSHVNNKRTTCLARAHVHEGEPSAITCHFPDDLRHGKLDFTVVRHDLDGADPLGDLILSCIWNQDEYNPSCAKKTGYQASISEAGDVVTLEIPRTEEDHVGRYSCRYAFSCPDEQESCILAIKGRNIFCTVPSPSVSVGDAASITCHFNSDLRMTGEKFHVYRFDDNETPPVEVANCSWVVQVRNGQPRCQVKPGYRLDTATIGHSATLSIDSAEQEHTGRYSCRIIPPSKNVEVTDCTLTVREVTASGVTSADSGHGEGKTVIFPAQNSLDVPCGSKKHFQEGKPALIASQVPEHLDRKTAEIYVTRDADGDGGSGHVAYCKREAGCHVRSGYRVTVDWKEGYIVVTIPRVSQRHEGKYSVTVRANSYHDTQAHCLYLIKGEDSTDQFSNRAAFTQGSQTIVLLIPIASLLV